ncbi:MAG: hypothetical protein B7Z55_13570 [Planctomycetales bacterium 12-60-4]|nr:MAG: hypothetical protein B7Z55_13570 [Planctomycetales bacterium 12-60-4]
MPQGTQEGAKFQENEMGPIVAGQNCAASIFAVPCGLCGHRFPHWPKDDVFEPLPDLWIGRKERKAAQSLVNMTWG